MDQKQNRVAADLAQIDAMTREWGKRYGKGSKRAKKEFGRTKVALQKEVVRRYQGKPMTEAEKRELKMLKAENKDLAKESRRSFWPRVGNGIAGAGKFLLKGTGFVLGVAAAGVLALAGLMGYKGATRKQTPVVKLGNQTRSRVLNSKSPAGKVFSQAQRYYGKNAKSQQRTAPRATNGLGR